MAPKPAHPHEKKMVGLPILVATPTDLGRLIRELEDLNEQILQAGLRDKEHAVKKPETSRFMDKVLEINKVDLLDEAERKLLYGFLNDIKSKAPVIHMSFSADPSPAFMDKLVSWLRQEIHPVILVTVGMQANLGAGCIVRTTNKYFDLSLRQDFMSKRDLLLKAISEKAPAVSAAPQEVHA
jgi:F0F1-type ATP synthase delta subunit